MRFYPLVLLLFVTGCLIVNSPRTFEMPPVETLPEERNVLVAWPILPVDITVID
jgi:hypothetical protein